MNQVINLKENIIGYLDNENFQELFINQLGWDVVRDKETTYNITNEISGSIIAQKCSFCLKPKELSLPKYVSSELNDEFTVLKQISESGLEKRLKENQIFQDFDKIQIYKNRLNKELDLSLIHI